MINIYSNPEDITISPLESRGLTLDFDGYDLVISVSDREKIAHIVDNNNGYIRAEKITFFGAVYEMGLRFMYLDDIGALSEAPAIVLPVYLPEGEGYQRYIQARGTMPYGLPRWVYDVDWSQALIWSAIEYYQIKSPLDDLIESGRCVFRFSETE